MPGRQRFQFRIFPTWQEALGVTGEKFVDGYFDEYIHYLQVIEGGQLEHMRFFVVAVQDEEKNCFVGWLYGQVVPFRGRYLLPVFEQEAMKAPWWVRVVNRYETNLFYMGNLFFPGDNGFYLEAAYDTPGCRAEIISQVMPELRTFLIKRCEGGIFSVADYAPDTIKEPAIAPLKGFSNYYTEPYMFLQMESAWHSLDDYMADLSSKYRVRLKKVLADSATLKVVEMDASMLEQYSHKMHELYLSVAQKAHFNLGFVHPGYFRQVMEVSGGHFHVQGYWLDDQLIGFNSWFSCDDDNLHAHYIGLDYSYVTSHKLYNRMLIDLVDHAIRERAGEIHFGRTAIEIKSTLGAVPANMMIRLRHTRGWANRLIGFPSRWTKPPEYVIRHPFR